MADAPLAFRLRPEALEDFVGQQGILAPGTPLREAIAKDQLRSVILAGPPGTGKTTIAHIIASATKAHFVQLNAVLSGVKELREVCGEAERLFTTFGQRTVLFVDEIHRFNKGQQDALLPYVESGTTILIGATTANPYFEVNAALVSRSQVYLLKPHAVEDLVAILGRALVHPAGYGGKVRVSDAALVRIAEIANGDARIALNALELTVVMTSDRSASVEDVQRLFSERSKRYDRTGEEHYNTISAFIKSLRGSDADAALVWMYKMLESGEEPRFLFRRMAIFASEDIGNADPQALQLVVSAWQAFELVGFPEGEFFLAQACLYLGQAPKSNAITRAMHGGKQIVKQSPSLEVPNHLRNAPVKGMKEQGYGQGYRYPHDDDRGVVPGQYFPLGVPYRVLYQPTDRGYEREIRERMAVARRIIVSNE